MAINITVPSYAMQILESRGLNTPDATDYLLSRLSLAIAELANVDPYDSHAESRIQADLYNRITWEEVR